MSLLDGLFKGRKKKQNSPATKDVAPVVPEPEEEEQPVSSAPAAPEPVMPPSALPDLNQIREQLREIEDIIGPSPTAQASTENYDQLYPLELPLAEVLKLIPPVFLEEHEPRMGDTKSIVVPVDSLFEQLMQGRVTTTLGRLISELPVGYVVSGVEDHAGDEVALPLPVLISNIPPDELAQRTSKTMRDVGQDALPNLFSQEALAQAAEPPPPEEPAEVAPEPAPEPEPVPEPEPEPVADEPVMETEEESVAAVGYADSANEPVYDLAEEVLEEEEEEADLEDDLAAARAAMEASTAEPPVVDMTGTEEAVEGLAEEPVEALAEEPVEEVEEEVVEQQEEVMEAVETELPEEELEEADTAELTEPEPFWESEASDLVEEAVEETEEEVEEEPPEEPEEPEQGEPEEEPEVLDSVEAETEELPREEPLSDIYAIGAETPDQTEVPEQEETPVEVAEVEVSEIEEPVYEAVSEEPVLEEEPEPVPQGSSEELVLEGDITEEAVEDAYAALQEAEKEEDQEGNYLFLRGLDLNKATAEELCSRVDGVGPKMAERIVADREENGPFFYLFDLARVPGLGRKTFEQMTGLPLQENMFRYLGKVQEIMGPVRGGLPDVRIVAERFHMMDGFDGCVLTHEDGYLLSASWDHKKRETFGVFAPQMFKKIARYVKQLDLGALSSITVFLEQQPYTLVRSGDLILIAVHTPSRFSKKHVHIAQAIGAELGRRLSIPV